MTLLAARRGLGFPKVRRAVIGDESEKSFQRRVRRFAELCGWRVSVTPDSRNSPAGEPDLRLVRPPRYMLIELKSEHGRLRPEQRDMLALLKQCPGIESFVFKPSDWPRIVEVLR